jgi:formylglycine-generating enzyme required for sulfatase activity
MSNLSKMTVLIRVALIVLPAVSVVCTDVRAQEYEGAFPGYYTNLQRPPEETFREGKLLTDSDEEGHAIFEIPRDTFGAAKFVLHNTSNEWTVGTVWFYMLPQKVFVGTRKVNIEPGKNVVVVIPTKFAVNEVGVRFTYDVEYGFGKKWSGKFSLRMAQGEGGEKTPNSQETGAMRTSGQGAQGHTIVNSVGMKLVYIRAGEFMMGSSSNVRREESPRHKVRITQGFYIGATEVTQEQWKAIMSTTIAQQRDKLDSIFSLVGQGESHPVYFISWKEATEFCERLGRAEGRHYRLPTEAEWEYACRAGSGASYSFGDEESLLAEYDWYSENSGRQTQRVGQKRPNAWGLYDMHGNVSEWCRDWYEKNYYSTSPVTDPQGPVGGERRVVRGGDWVMTAIAARCASRGSLSPETRDNATGLRVVLEAGE